MNNLLKRTMLPVLEAFKDSDGQTVVELQDANHKVVGSLNLAKINTSDLVVSETNNEETFYLYYHGIGIYFSYFRKIGY